MESSSPDAPAGPEPERAPALKFACPNDGSTDIYWEIESRRLICRYCRKAIADDPTPATGQVLNGIAVAAGASQVLPVDNICVFRCESCGAEVITDTTTGMSARCSWCRSNLIAGDVISNEFTPDGIIPFAMSEKQAIDSFRKWVRKHWFVRKDFGNVPDLIIKPVYYPFYVLDATMQMSVNGVGEKQVRRYRSGNYDCIDYERYRLHGPAVGYIDDQERVALSEIVNETIVSLIRPFDWSAPHLRQFDYRYLNGYNAEHRDIDFHSIQRSVQDEEAAAVTSEFDRELDTEMSPRIDGTTPVIGYVLAPVWLLTYVDDVDDRTYFFAINGQNGRSAGVLPLDWRKSSVFIMGCTAVMAVGGFLFEYLRLRGLAG